MTIIGIGVDIISIERIKSATIRNGDRFAKRILNYDEWITYSRRNQPVSFLAKRFAAKEAVSKAFGTGIGRGLTFTQIQVYNDGLGRPYIRLFGRALEMACQLEIKNMHITLADDRCYACAIAILER